MSAVSDEKNRAVILDELEPRSVIEELPQTVFPVTAKLKLDRSVSGDGPHKNYQPPNFPVEVREPTVVPYIPETTVYFDNPAERAPDGAYVWRPLEFLSEMDDLLDYLEKETQADPDRLLLTGLVVVEVPSKYLTSTENGRWVKGEMYDEGGEFTLGYFQKHSSLSAHNVREELGDALPGETRTPLQLVQVSEVTAKPSRAERETVQQASRARYFTEAEAENADRLKDTPNHWKSDRVSRVGEESYPLDTVIDDIGRFLPALAETDLIRPVTFKGETVERQQFYAEEVLEL